MNLYCDKLKLATKDLLNLKKNVRKYQSFVSICKKVLLKRLKGEEVKQIFDDTIVQHFLLASNNYFNEEYDTETLVAFYAAMAHMSGATYTVADFSPCANASMCFLKTLSAAHDYTPCFHAFNRKCKGRFPRRRLLKSHLV